MGLELTENGRKVDVLKWLRHMGMYKSSNDELIDIMVEVLRGLAPAHGIANAEFSSTKDTIHAVLTINGKAFYMTVPAVYLDKTRKKGIKEMTRERAAEAGKRFKKMFLDAMGRR